MRCQINNDINSFNAVFERLKASSPISNQKALADALGIKQPSISDAKRRKVFLRKWGMQLSVAYSIDVNYLLYGMEAPKKTEIRGLDDGALSERERVLKNIYEQLLEAKDLEIELLKKGCNGKHKEGNGKTDPNEPGFDPNNNGQGFPLPVPR